MFSTPLNIKFFWPFYFALSTGIKGVFSNQDLNHDDKLGEIQNAKDPKRLMQESNQIVPKKPIKHNYRKRYPRQGSYSSAENSHQR
jgi:hypothetical protein